MQWLTAASDTWGISGPTFLLSYVLLAVGALGLAAVWRVHLRRRHPESPPGDLAPGQAGYLAGGPKRAVLAEVGVLRAAGVLCADRGTLVRTGSRPAGLDPLGAAVFNAAPGRTWASLRRHSWVRAALGELERDLGRAGLVFDAAARSQARLGGWLVLAVAAFGLARTLAGLSNDRSVGYLALATAAAAVAGILLVIRPPRRTRAGDRALAAARSRYAHLAPNQHPAWSAYGPAAAGIGVGVFGVGALLAADPTFAAQAAVGREGAGFHGLGGGGGGYGVTGGGAGDGGGSSDGGGGCGG